jgi:hypothetical protein
MQNRINRLPINLYAHRSPHFPITYAKEEQDKWVHSHLARLQSNISALVATEVEAKKELLNDCLVTKGWERDPETLNASMHLLPHKPSLEPLCIYKS